MWFDARFSAVARKATGRGGKKKTARKAEPVLKSEIVDPETAMGDGNPVADIKPRAVLSTRVGRTRSPATKAKPVTSPGYNAEQGGVAVTLAPVRWSDRKRKPLVDDPTSQEPAPGARSKRPRRGETKPAVSDKTTRKPPLASPTATAPRRKGRSARTHPTPTTAKVTGKARAGRERPSQS